MKTNSKTLVVSTEKRFTLNTNGKIVNEDNTRSRFFWERYLEVFEKVIVVARVDLQSKIKSTNFVENDRIKVYKLSNYQGAVQGILSYKTIKKEITNLVNMHSEDFFLLRVPGAIGTQIGKILISSQLKYSLEVVGDPFEVYITQKGLISKILAYKERANLRKLIKNAESITYVTQFSLQKNYPFHNNGFQTYYSSIQLKNQFFVKEKKFLPEPLIMIGIGSLEMPYKGVAILLKALVLLNESHINFRLTWIGNGKFLNKYKSFVNDNGLSEKVYFLGSVPNEEIPNYLQENNIFVLPSLTEGLPRALVEAMASRLICLGSTVGGIPELINKECLFPSKNPQAIFALLQDIHKRFPYYEKYAEINYNRALEYKPKVLNERRKMFYNSIKNNEI